MSINIDWSVDESTLRKQLLAYEKSKLIKICKTTQVPHHGNKNDVIDRLIDKKKKKSIKKSKKKSNKTVVKIDAPTKENKIKTQSSTKRADESHNNNNNNNNNNNDDEKNTGLLSPLYSPQSPETPQITAIDTKQSEFEMKHDPKPFHIKIDKLNNKKKRGSYIWILDKNRKLRSIPSPIPVAQAHKRAISLTNSHNFLWITSVLRGTLHAAKVESEITKSSFDRLLSLLPKRYRLKIWQIINVDQDSFIVYEDYNDFVDSLLIATGQKDDIDDEEDDFDIEIRDMRPVFNKIVNVEEMFRKEEYMTKSVSRSRSALSIKGAQRIVMDLRNINCKESDNKKNLKIVNDLALPILTGLTKKALIHGVAYCTRTYWKILTDVFWDEEDEEDFALCTPISHFTNVKAIGLKELFGDLYCEMNYDLAEIQENVVQTIEENASIDKYLDV